MKYINAAGYTPYAAASMLTQLNAETTLDAQIAGRSANAVPTWASTHPNGADRIRRAQQLAQATGKAQPAAVQDTAFLRRLDGLLYDDDPKEGVIDGQTFRHPGLKLRFSAPAGYTIANGTDAVTISGSAGRAQFRTAAATTDLAGFVTKQFTALGASSVGEVSTGTANGLTYATATAQASASGQAVDATIVAYAFPAATNWFLLITPRGSGTGALQPLIASVAQLSTAEAAAIKGKRLRIVAVKAGDTIDSLSRQMAYTSYQRERFLTLNGIGATETLKPGRLVKIVTAG